MNRFCFRPRPLKTVFRLTDSGSHPNFRLPFHGWWAITSIAGGGGGGATHISYAAPSEHGFNGRVENTGYIFRRTLLSTAVIGAAGLGGTATNNNDIPAQTGKVGGNTDSGTNSPRNGGDGGRSAFQASGLDPTQPSGVYPNTAYDNRSVSGGTLLGVIHNGGGVVSTAGRGGVGRTSPAQDGGNGTKGRADYYCKG